MNAKIMGIDSKEVLRNTVLGLYVALQNSTQNEEEQGTEEQLIMYAALMNSIVSYTALCGVTPHECVNWINDSRSVDVDLMHKVLNDYDVVLGLTDIGIDVKFLVDILPEPQVNKVSNLLAQAAGDKVEGNLNPPNTNTGWEVPKVYIQSVLPLTNQDGTAGLEHCVAILAKVYTRLQYKFLGKSYEDGQRIAQQLLNSMSSEVYDCMKVDNTEPTIADTVTLAESIFWTAGYVTTGASGNFVLGYAGFEPEDKFAMKRPSVWNCMRTTSSCTSDEYANYGYVQEGHGKNIPILATSVDTLKVTMQEV